MNFRRVSRNLGWLILLVSLFMASSLVWIGQDYQRDPAVARKVVEAFGLSVLIGGILGTILFRLGQGGSHEMLRKEALAVVGLGWVIVGLFGSLPYILSDALVAQYQHLPDRIAAAVFESISGFTTTGSSMLTDIESLPTSLLFWRSMTHWLGGIGIVALFVAVLSATGPASKHLFLSETSGVATNNVQPRTKQAALLLLKVYLGLSLLQFVILRLLGMNTFESLCHTFGTVATGGFSPLNQSIGEYNSLKFEIVIIVFMILAGINFNLHGLLVQGQWKTFYRNRELRTFLAIIFVVTSVITVNLLLQHQAGYNLGHALREALFNTVSCVTCTGFCVDDFDKWPALSRWLLMMVMIIGGSAGSTAGGLKVIRVMLIFRIVSREIERTFRPRVVRPFRINQKPVDDAVINNVAIFTLTYLLMLLIFPVILTALQNVSAEPTRRIDMESAFSAVIACQGGVGPGLGLVGPAANFHFLVPAAKIFLCIVMLLGRLEIMAFLCLFAPAFWRRD